MEKREGQHRVPTKIRMMRGTLRADRKNEFEAKPPTEVPRCSPEVKGEARREWNRLAPVLVQLGLVSRIDGGVLTSYCLAWATMLDAQKVIARDGLFVVRDGVLRVNPAVAVRDKAAIELRHCGEAMGLSAAARSKVQAVPVAPTAPTPTESEAKFFGQAG